VRTLLEQHVDHDASVLEVGCSSGRHLAHLHENGFGDLAGIEMNETAFDVMARTYPDLADSVTFYHDAVEAVVETFEDGRFDAVYSVETLQHVHPDAEWVFAELARVTDDLLVTVENEGDDDQAETTEQDVNYVNDEFPLHYRNWNRIFTDLGFEEIAVSSNGRDTTRAFQPTSDAHASSPRRTHTVLESVCPSDTARGGTSRTVGTESPCCWVSG
jgi:SAM-dependent methyltransferase